MRGWREERRLTHAVAIAVLMAGVPAASGAAGVSAIEWPIVFTQLPPRAEIEGLSGFGEGTVRRDYGDGGRLVRLDPGSKLTVLTGAFSSACGADVSFDGERILFAGKKAPGDPWNIWEMNADGSGARQVTRDCGNCKSPAYLATFYTIVSTEPWYQIVFVSDKAGHMNEYGGSPATSLYSCRLDGSSVRRLTMNLSDDMDPFPMSDGRVLLASWQRMGLERGFAGRVSLFGVGTDGTDYALFCGDEGRRVKHMPCETADGLIVFVEADRVGWDGAGRLASVTLRRNFHSHRAITTDDSGLFHAPSPLPDGSVLVSRRSAGAAAPPKARANRTHGLYRFDPRDGRATPVFDDPGRHDMHARVLASRLRPDGRSSVVNEKYASGQLYCLNTFLTEPSKQPHWPLGLVTHIRVIEGVPRPVEDRSSQVPIGNNSAPVVGKRVLGTVPVQKDGSFNIAVPADLAVQLQALDEHGMALRTCGWIWVKHREPRGCIGCHEDPELTPENRFVLAIQQPAVDLTAPPEKRPSLDFRRGVMPIIAGKCAVCHDRAGVPPDMGSAIAGHFTGAYVSLVGADQTPQGKYVHPGRARTSPLIWRLYGRNMSRPWDASYAPLQKVTRCPPSQAQQLTDDEKRKLVEWIDLGAHWDSLPTFSEEIAK